MLAAGIPPSPDRQDRLLQVVLLAFLLLGVFTGISYVILSQDRIPVLDRVEQQDDGDTRLQAYLAEKERASAYAFVRDHLDQRSNEPAIAAVYCRDSWHQWINDTIEFKGDVDFVDPLGRSYPHRYTATLTGSAKDGWELVSIDVQPETSASPERPGIVP